MGVFIYNAAKLTLLSGQIALATDTFKAVLCMTSTTAGDNAGNGRDAIRVNGINLDEFDGTNYARKTLTTFLLLDNNNDRVQWDANDFSWVELGKDGGGSRQIAGMLIYVDGGGDDSTHVPMVWFDSPFVFPFQANGSDVTIQFGGLGIFFTRSV